MPINNPMQLIGMIKNSANPEQFVMNMLEQQVSNTPLGQNIINLAKGNNSAGIEAIARNMFKERGLDFDKEFNSFKQNLGL